MFKHILQTRKAGVNILPAIQMEFMISHPIRDLIVRTQQRLNIIPLAILD